MILDMATDTDPVPRGPLRGRVIIEWVDAADPADASQPPNFDWSIKAEPPLDDERVSLLLREVSEAY
jgi:hypothetical protein